MNQTVSNYVKIMPEHCANPIWDSEGRMMSWSTLDLPDDHLLNELVIWNFQWEELASLGICEDDYQYSEEELEGFERILTRGRKLAAYVKHYKPDWTVMFSDERCLVEITEGEPMWKTKKVDLAVRECDL